MTDYKPIAQAILSAPDCSDKAKQAGAELVQGWITKYGPVDEANLKVHEAEAELMWRLPEPENTCLVGRVDLIGQLGVTPVLGEWKTSRPDGDWRTKWRFSIQGLTYGVLLRRGIVYATGVPRTELLVRKFFKLLVRTAFKLKIPGYDQELFDYTEAELNNWERQIKGIAEDIWRLHSGIAAPWPQNPKHCFRYGKNYPCPFYHNGCETLDFTRDLGYPQRVPHLEVERNSGMAKPDATPVGGSTPPQKDALMKREDHHAGWTPASRINILYLDATRIETFLECREKYRREYIQNLGVPPNEAMQIGLAFHAGLASYYQQIKDSK